MIQNLMVFAIVGLAAAWTGWSLILRGWLSRRAKANSETCCGAARNRGD